MSKGIKLALITAVVSGVAIFVNKFAVDAIKPPLMFTAVKNLMVAVMVVGWTLTMGKWKMIGKLKKDELGKLALIGLIGGALPFYLFFTGLSQVPAINGALIHKTLVVWVAILAVPLLKERLSVWQWLGVVMLFGSNLLVGGFKGFAWSWAELMVLAATILWAIENVIAKKVLPTVDPDLVVGARMGLGSLILLGAAILRYPQAMGQIVGLNGSQWGWLVLSAVILMMYVMSWYRALKIEKAVTVTAVLVAATLVTNVLSAIFVTHTWNLLLGVQAGLMVAGAGVLGWQARKVSVRSEESKELLTN